MAEHDLVIRNGNLVDGSGGEGRTASVAIDSDAPRYAPRARGYPATVCGGAITVENDEFTGQLPGRLLRGPR